MTKKAKTETKNAETKNATTKKETATMTTTTTSTESVAMDVIATDCPAVRPSFIPEMISGFVIKNNDAKIWSPKSFKMDGEDERILKFYVIADNKRTIGELTARLFDQGFVVANHGATEKIDVTRICVTYFVRETDNEAFRAAFRATKSPAGYNKEGMVAMILAEAEEKAKKAEEAAEARRAEKLKRDIARAQKKLAEVQKKIDALKAQEDKNAA